MRSRKRRGSHGDGAGAESRAKPAEGVPGAFRPFRDLRDRLPAPKPAAPPPPPKPAPEPPQRDRDEDAFRLAMSGVDRARDVVPPVPREGPPAPPPEDEFAVAERFLASFVDGETPFEFADTTEYIEGSVRGLDSRIPRKLRAGEFAVEAHLDLHGLDRAAAKQAVRRFVEQCQVAEKRCVLVIHGRGLGSKDHVPVLKENLREWLTRGGIGNRVLAYTSARPCDGGAGAVYVLLRRLRERKP